MLKAALLMDRAQILPAVVLKGDLKSIPGLEESEKVVQWLGKKSTGQNPAARTLFSGNPTKL